MPDKDLVNKLNERIKELTCLYEVSSIAASNFETTSEALQAIANRLPQAWQYTESAKVEIKVEDIHVFSAKIDENTVQQKTLIEVENEIIGFIVVHYPSDRYKESDFLPEEQKLLQKVSHEVSVIMERRRNKKREENLQRSLERTDRLTILGEITAGIAHELNTPLGNILGFAELIQSKSKEDQVQKDVKKIVNAAIFAREVVKKLMFFSCEMPQQMEFVQVKPIVENALRLMGPTFQKTNIRYDFICNNDEIEAQLDPIQIIQVLFNLLSNAIYASPEGSKMQIDLLTEGNVLTLQIADEGEGIADDIKQKMFEPFFTTKPVGEGSGLGLSVVHGIVKSHRGSISCKNNIPKGTIFTITLPLKQ